jgi:PGF-pre-PGF domain-containing protein
MNITGGLYGGPNATFFYNASGGPAERNLTSDNIANMGNLTGLLRNESYNDTEFNITINTSWLADGRRYNISCFVSNGTTNETVSVFNVTFDKTPPRVVFVATNISNAGNYSNTTFIINVSVFDATIGMLGNGNDVGANAGNVYINITNSSGGQAPTSNNFTRAINASGTNSSGGYYNITFNAAVFPDGKYNITVWANDSAYLNDSSNAVYANSNKTTKLQFTIDTVAPTVPVLTNSTDTTTTQIVATITTSDATTGIDYCIAGGSPAPSITGRGTETQILTHTGLECGHSYSFTITCYDFMGFSNVSTTSLSTRSCSTSDTPGGGGTTPTTTSAIEKKFSLNILPAQEGVLSNFQESMGVEEIKIRVNEVANNVKITIKKFDTQPSEISVPKTGQVHKYIQIIAENLGTKLEGATLEFKVQKNWLSDNGIDKANIALFRLDESAGKWDELTAVYKEEDVTYYYYEAQLTSFSFFAIAEKSVVLPGEPEEEIPVEVLSVTFLKQNWVWIVVGAVVLLGVVGALLAKKGRKKKR